MDPAASAREHAVADHRDTVAAVLAAADEAAADLALPATRSDTVAALDDALAEESRVGLVALLRGAVDATGRELLAEPVPAAPYLVVTARGPLVRATLADGRLVVLVRAFERTDAGYVRAGCDPATAVEARFRRRP